MKSAIINNFNLDISEQYNEATDKIEMTNFDMERLLNHRTITIDQSNGTYSINKLAIAPPLMIFNQPTMAALRQRRRDAVLFCGAIVVVLASAIGFFSNNNNQLNVAAEEFGRRTLLAVNETTSTSASSGWKYNLPEGAKRWCEPSTMPKLNFRECDPNGIVNEIHFMVSTLTRHSGECRRSERTIYHPALCRIFSISQVTALL